MGLVITFASCKGTRNCLSLPNKTRRKVLAIRRWAMYEHHYCMRDFYNLKTKWKNVSKLPFPESCFYYEIDKSKVSSSVILVYSPTLQMYITHEFKILVWLSHEFITFFLCCYFLFLFCCDALYVLFVTAGNKAMQFRSSSCTHWISRVG